MSESIKKQPWLSVIVPIFNAEKYLAKCIKSVLKQSFCDFELILVDDESTDETPSICKEFAGKDDRIRYLRKENGGSFKARIYGTNHALGQYILFCDADDYYCSSHAFQELYDVVQKYDCDMVEFGHYKHFNYVKKKYLPCNETELCSREVFIDRDYPRLLCSFWDGSKITITIWDKLYRKDLSKYLPDIENVGRLFMGDDQVLNLFLLEHLHSAVFYPKALYNYRQKTGGSHNWKKETMYDVDQIKRYQLDFLERYQADQSKKDKIKETIHLESVYWLFNHIKKGTETEDDAALCCYVKDCFELSCFRTAREYFITENQIDWYTVRLLKKGDPVLYVKEANRQQKKIKTKTKIKNWLYDHI